MNIITDYMPWLLSAITIYATWLAGNKHRHTWAVSLANQGLWLTWILTTKTWGFLPMNIALAAMMLRNHFKWQYLEMVADKDPTWLR